MKSDNYSCEALSIDQYKALDSEVYDLHAHAAIKNIFGTTVALDAAIAAGLNKDHFQIIACWQRQPRGLVGLWPLYQTHKFGLPILSNSFHEYMMLGSPYYHEAQQAAVWREIQNFLKSTYSNTILEAKNIPQSIADIIGLREEYKLSSIQRGVFYKDSSSHKEFLKARFSKQRLRTYQKNQKRLHAQGVCDYHVYQPGDIQSALQQFFALERSGWKGKKGTAVSSKKNDEKYISELVAGYANKNQIHLSALRLDGTPIAMALLLKCHGVVWFLKLTYDETFAKFSPGILLTHHLADNLNSDTDFLLADSCAPLGIGQHVAICNQALEVSDYLQPLSGSPTVYFRILFLALKLFKTARQIMKTYYIKISRK